MNNLEYKNGNIVLRPLKLTKNQQDELLNICSLFGYILDMKHNKMYRLCPIITNGEGTRFGYIQVRECLKIISRFSIVIPFEGKHYTIYFNEDSYIEIDSINNRAFVEVYPGKMLAIKLSYFFGFEPAVCSISEAIYFVFKTNIVNLSERYVTCKSDIKREKKSGGITHEVLSKIVDSYKVPALI